ncbi:sulfatase-like hydrolase/transferase [Rubripirellula sp.]|nr:sulfatase-like hydrolase/transferase [Rubripirellula sp.]MDB4621607.1 sulfatase-like hydrolase/transferase [Rubripirellula sp.]
MPVSKQTSRSAAGKAHNGPMFFATLSLWLCSASITFAEVSSAGLDRPPNIVLIIADDQRYSDFGFMGNARVQTPNLDELARGAAIYTDAYVPSSVCRPSLVTLLTGLYPHQHGVHFNHPPPGFSRLTKSSEIDRVEFDRLRQQAVSLIRARPTLPRILAARGYRCFQTGKYWEGHWRNAGFTEGMTIAQPSGGRYGDKRLASGDLVAHGNGDHGLAIGRETMEPIATFLDDVNQDPFFLWYAPFLPHTPHDSSEKFKRAVAANPKVKPHEVPYFAAIMQFDATVGKLIRMIDQRGMRDNTLFVFVADNGWEPDPARFRKSMNDWDHTSRSKRSPFESGLRTPVLIQWAGRTKAAKHNALVNTIDLMPTLLQAAGVVDGPAGLPGISLWPSAVGEQSLSRERAVFGEIYPGDASMLGAPEHDLAYRWIRKGKYKLIVPSPNGKQHPWNRYVENATLFDLVQDPTETNNLIDDPRQSDVVATLSKALESWWSP